MHSFNCLIFLNCVVLSFNSANVGDCLHLINAKDQKINEMSTRHKWFFKYRVISLHHFWSYHFFTRLYGATYLKICITLMYVNRENNRSMNSRNNYNKKLYIDTKMIRTSVHSDIVGTFFNHLQSNIFV